jgi:predicted nucleotidyltransferase component of viral defense system
LHVWHFAWHPSLTPLRRRIVAKKKGRAGPSQYERLESIKRLVVIAMFSDDMLMERLVLKGGNALDIIHKISLRASVDVDFSIADDILEGERKAFRDTIERVLKETFKPEKYEVFDVKMVEKPKRLTPDMADFWGGYHVEFKLIEEERYRQFSSKLGDLQRNALQLGQGAKFLIDISKFEYTAGKVPHDLDGYRIFVYSPQMIVAEKLRAICQQMKEYAPVIKRSREATARARDFVDIHTVIKHFKLTMTSPENRELVRNVFAAKKVPLELLGRIPDYQDFHERDFQAVKDTVKSDVKLNEFSVYFEFVASLARELSV